MSHNPMSGGERGAASLAGALLLGGATLLGCLAARRRSPGWWLLVLAGGALAWGAVKTPAEPRWGRRRIALARRRDIVDVASQGSFPASDPPPWTDTHAQPRG